MTPRRLLARSLVHFRALHGAVALGVGVGTAVLAGALIVGSSVRESLRNLTLDRLGAIDFAAVGERYFRETATEAFEASAQAASAVLIRGSAEHAGSGARASKVRIHGVDSTFWAFYDIAAPELGNREIALNQRLAAELGAQEGDDLLLRFQTDALVPAESVMGRKADNVRLLRLRVASVLDDAGPGRFGLSPQQQLPYNAFVSKLVLQRALEQPGRANALFVSGSTLEAARIIWQDSFSLEDARLVARPLPEGRGALIESERVVLDPAAATAVAAAAEATGWQSSEVLTYLANTIETEGGSVPYSTVTALEAHPEQLLLANGTKAPELGDSEILLNQWAADDLQARPGNTVRLTYYVVGPGSELQTASHEFNLVGIVRMAGAALDRDYAPTYKGMSDKTRISNWDPPFPMDLRLIRPRDEQYWDRYRAAPKAFVSLPTAKELWTSRFGQLTSLRLEPAEQASQGETLAGFRTEVQQRLDPAEFGLALQPVKQSGLEASAGATDFSGLFIGFSMFLIAAAAILVSLLFRLGVELRAKEIGTLLATGHTLGFVRMLLLCEGAALAAAGCLIGIPGAVAYASLMLYGLSTWWSGAVGGSFLELHLGAEDPLMGSVSAFVLMFASIGLSLRHLGHLSPNALLSGRLESATSKAAAERKSRRLRVVAVVLAIAALGLLGISLGADSASRLGAFFGAGTLALAAALVLLRSVLLRPQRGALNLSSIAGLGFRNGSRNPTRSVLSATLVACASFMIVTVAMNRHDVSGQEPNLHSGDGGFRLLAEADLPLFKARIDEVAAASEGSMHLTPLRIRPGEDASCLNLYQPSEPTLAGIPQALVRRGGFAFQASLAETEAERENPWLLLEKDFGEAIPVFGDANSVTWILHLALGDELEVIDSSGQHRRLLIAGLLSRSIFQSELLAAEDRFLDLYSDHSGYQALLVETDDDSAGGPLEEAFADEGLDAVMSADRLAGFLVVENTYLSTFQTIGGLGLLLGTLGLAVVMVRSVIERRGELALLGALGFSQAAVARLVLLENSFLLVFGVGTGATAALLAIAPHLASGAADPPWLPLTLTLGAIVGLGLAAGAVAANVALRAPLLASLRRD